MNDDLTERVARTIHAKEYDPEHYPFEREDAVTQLLLKDQARAAIAVCMEEAAKVADGWVGCSEWSADTNSGYECASREIAAAIRALVKHD